MVLRVADDPGTVPMTFSRAQGIYWDIVAGMARVASGDSDIPTGSVEEFFTEMENAIFLLRKAFPGRI